MTTTRTDLVLALIFVGAFVMGCAEMLVVGLLDLITENLSVSVPAAGALVTANALGLAIGGPLLTLLTTRLDRRTVLLAALAVFVLPSVPTPPGDGAAGQARHAFAPRVLAVLGVCFLVFTAVQSVLTYLAPFLGQVTGVTGAGVGAYLLVYGVATTVGSSAGGRFADAGASRTLVVGTTVSLAGPGAPLASSLPASAVNGGIACGSLAGGAAIRAGGTPAAVVTGVVVSVLAVGMRPCEVST